MKCIPCVAAATFLIACGGSTEESRAEATADYIDRSLQIADHGGGLYSCEVDDSLEFKTLYDFEIGGVAGLNYYNDNTVGSVVTPSVVTDPFYSQQMILCREEFPQHDECGNIVPESHDRVPLLDQDGKPELNEDGEVVEVDRWKCQDFWEGERANMEPMSELAEELPGGRCGSVFGFNLKVENLASWGGVLIFGMPSDPSKSDCEYSLTADTAFEGNPCLGMNVSEWDGISMWVRRAPLTQAIFNLELVTRNTHAINSKLLTLDPDQCGQQLYDGRGSCDADIDGCTAFTHPLITSTTWQHVFLPFEDFMQRDGPYVDEPDLTTLREIIIRHGMADMDIWIDDIQLYRKKDQAVSR